LVVHLEDPDLVGGAEAVLHRPQHAIRVVLLALEVEHGVHQVLEHARPGQRPFLGHVANQERRDATSLGERHQAGAALAHLGHAARRGLDVGQKDGLDRVHDQGTRLDRIELTLHRGEIVLGPQ
jgi:hypothetical protein